MYIKRNITLKKHLIHRYLKKKQKEKLKIHLRMINLKTSIHT